MNFIDGMRLLAGAPADLANGEHTESSAEWSFVKAGKWLGKMLDELRDPQQAAGKPPRGLKATLRPYQQDGAAWLWLLSNLGFGACLADDMGLGKTIQVLALLLQLKQRSKPTKPSLLVLPASLLGTGWPRSTASRRRWRCGLFTRPWPTAEL